MNINLLESLNLENNNYRNKILNLIKTKCNEENKYDFNVSMGKYISDKVMLRYTHGFSGRGVNRYGVQYDINDRWGVTLERESNGTIFGVEARMTF